MRLHLSHSKRFRTWRIFAVLLVAALVGTVFQNCSPVGGTGAESASTLGTGLTCPNPTPPSISSTIITQAVKSGLGGSSGDVYPQNLSVSVKLGYTGQNYSFDCNINGVDGVDINCNSATDIDLRSMDGAECLSGTATATIRVRDPLCATTSNQVSFQINVQNVCPQQQVALNPDAETNDQFGNVVAISGNNAVVVATSDNQKAADAGAAYVYSFDGTNWVMKQKLMPTSLVSRSEMTSAAISGNVIALGIPYQGNAGVVVIYRYNGSSWVESQTLAPSVSNSTLDDELFGFDVALSGSTLVVGMPGYNHGSFVNFAEAGAALVYSDSGSSFSETKVIAASDKAAHDFFGSRVSISGTRVAVGAPSSPTADKTAFKGKAYVYTTGTWAEAKLDAGADVGMGAEFGSAIDVDGTRVAIGAQSGKGKTNSSGVAFVFDGSGASWVKQAKLVASDGNDGDHFGASVAIEGNNLVIGAPLYGAKGMSKSGAAYQYTYGTSWAQKYILFPREADRGVQDQFGESVDISGAWFLGGSRLDDVPGGGGAAVLNAGSGAFIRLP